MKTAFISYRRSDSSGYTRSLYSDLVREFSAQQIFMDVDDILPGADFVTEINKKLQKTHVLIVMIGHKWINVTNNDGIRRLDDPKDFVRIEVEHALKRKINIIPILINDAPMPNEIELPKSLQPLARKQALSLNNKDYQYQLEKIIDSLLPILSPKKKYKNVTVVTKKTFTQRIGKIFMWIGIIVSILLIILISLPDDNTETSSSNSPIVSQPVVSQQQNFINIAKKNGLNIENNGSISLNTQLDISGIWYDESGGYYNFTQSNTMLNVNISTQQGDSQTSGLVVGQKIYFTDAVGTLEQDERHMQIAFNVGGNMRLHKEHQPQY